MQRILIVCGIVAAGYIAVQIGNRGRFRKQILILVSSCYGAGFIYWTFLSRAPGSSRINLIPFYFLLRSLWHPLRLENIRLALQNGQWERVFMTFQPIESAVLNVFLFIPFGFLLPQWKPQMRPAQVLSAGFLTSVAIEIIQPLTGLGWFDVDDLLCNIIGNAIGVILFIVGRRAGRRNRS